MQSYLPPDLLTPLQENYDHERRTYNGPIRYMLYVEEESDCNIIEVRGENNCLIAYLNEVVTICQYRVHIMFHLTAPTVAPYDIRVIATNSSSISVEWTKPNKSALHGVLRRYEIEYRRVECNEPDPVYVPSNTTWNLAIVSNTSSSKVIGGLVFWSCYELRMRAVTVGNGPFSDVQQVKTKENGKLLIVNISMESSLLIRQCVNAAVDIGCIYWVVGLRG